MNGLSLRQRAAASGFIAALEGSWGAVGGQLEGIDCGECIAGSSFLLDSTPIDGVLAVQI